MGLNRTPESSLDAWWWEIPTNFDGWESFSKKNSGQKGQILSGRHPKVKKLSRTVKWTLRAHFWVFFSKILPMASYDVCAHLTSEWNAISCRSRPPPRHLCEKWPKMAQIRHLRGLFERAGGTSHDDLLYITNGMSWSWSWLWLLLWLLWICLSTFPKKSLTRL